MPSLSGCSSIIFRLAKPAQPDYIVAMTLKTEDMLDAITLGEFPDHIRKTSEKVVVIMTQDWCPQWHAMTNFLEDFQDKASIFTLEYNRLPEFQSIMAFKENVFGNREVPYLRYYFQGELIVQTNYLNRITFAAMLDKTKPFSIR